MQAVTCFVQPPFLPTKSASSASPYKTGRGRVSCLTNRRTSPVKASASRPFETLSVNYNSPFSVFQDEACEVVGGDACTADMYSEVKLDTPEMKKTQTNDPNAMEHFDREYFDYSTDPKSVLREEACDDLGGEFCETS